MPSREDFLQWAEYLPIDTPDDAIIALCNRVWNEAIEAAAKYIEEQSLPDTYSEPCLAIFAKELRELKQGETK